MIARQTERERQREIDRDRQTDRDRETETQRETQRERCILLCSVLSPGQVDQCLLPA